MRIPATQSRSYGGTQREYRVQRIDFYDRRDDLLKTLTYEGYQSYGDNYWRPDSMIMVNHQTDKSTVLQFEGVELRHRAQGIGLHPQSLETRFMIAKQLIVAGALLLAPAAVTAQELTVEAAVETRIFPGSPRFSDQDEDHISPSLTLQPEFTYWVGDTDLRFRVSPYVRLDAHDERRSHFDIREATIQYIGNTWVVSAGINRVFWGVTESVHLIDIVNQIDGVEDLDGEDRLGQPMVSFTIEGSWGALDLIALPYFRERTYPGDDARLRGPLTVIDAAVYEDGDGGLTPDFAARWFHTLGYLDIGVSHFHGIGREPMLQRFVGERNGSPCGFASTDCGPWLQPHYLVIDQTAVDLQWTGDATLWKLEAMTRSGHGDRFAAFVAGVEHTLYGFMGGAADLGLLLEGMYDGRDDTAPPTIFEGDVFGGFPARAQRCLGHIRTGWATR